MHSTVPYNRSSTLLSIFATVMVLFLSKVLLKTLYSRSSNFFRE